MPLTDYHCPECGGVLHTDDLLEGKCVTPNCGAELPHKSELPTEWKSPDHKGCF